MSTTTDEKAPARTGAGGIDGVDAAKHGEVVRSADAMSQSGLPDGIVNLPLHTLKTPPENDLIYGEISDSDPDVIALADSIKKHGILEPLVISKDGYVLSGNRRRVAADLLVWSDPDPYKSPHTKVPCRVESITRDDPGFIAKLVAFNGQRIKNIRQMAHEIAVITNPDVAHRELVKARQSDPHIKAKTLCLGAYKGRSEIKGNKPLADACIKIIEQMQNYLPLSDRQIHYLLLNDPPLIHRSKGRRYANDIKSYKTLTNVLTRLRISGDIDMDAIADDTRPVTVWNVHKNPQSYLRDELASFLTNYWRDLVQSQKDHIELVVEKMTLRGILKSVSAEFCIPMTIGRGYSSLPPRYEMVERYRQSGKERLVVVVVSDLDPDGMTIAESFGRSLRDDFDIDADKLVCIKAALTIEQVQQLKLPPGLMIKGKASRAPEYLARYGSRVWELESVEPAKLKSIVRDALLSVMDVRALNTEQAIEVEEAAQIVGYRKAVLQIFGHDQELSNGGQR